MMDEEKYEMLKNDKEELLYELALSIFGEDDLVCNLDIEFKMNIINEFIDLEKPELIGGTYCFITNYVKFQDLHEKDLIQIGEGKFKNYIFLVK
ncbi:MAG: hypothetical protein ACREV6_25695 [Clostridium sp.]|uniref:hypothetical protein n=1 Tax=Clostridium sp. TaxID=1506 RepID=UPI003D6D5B21